MAETSLSASIPATSRLCCVVAQIDVSEIKDSSAKSNFHWKTMKCRLIIHTMPDTVIASPVYETIGSIHVITSVDFFGAQTLQNNLKEMNMTWSAPRPVTPDVYANCLRYSIQFAIAPRWNRVGQYLISDEYFLTFPYTFAMRFNLTVRAGREKNVEATLKLQPLKIHMYDVKLEDLKIPREIIEHFMADPRGIIDVASIGTFRATVLPSLKRGRLMTVLKYIPATSPFKNYGELRRHWKNMYGYRLPKTDDGIIYYDILFPVPTGDRFLYPDICVRSQVYERPYLGNPETVTRPFLRDLNETMPLVCGESLKIIGSSDDSWVNNSTSSIIEADESGTSRDLSKTPENPSRFQGLREKCLSTNRLSFSRGTRNELYRETSNLMSPTPSLRGGSTRGPTGNNKFRNVLTTLGRIDAKPILRFSRASNGPSETQNQCPNGEDPRSNDSQDLEGSEKFRTGDPDEEIILPMEMAEFQRESRVFRTLETPESSKMDVEDRDLTNSSGEVCSSFASDGRDTVKRKTLKVISDEIESRYFVRTIKEEPKRAREKMTLPIGRTLSQKLERNLSYTRQMADANSMGSRSFDSKRTPNRPDVPGSQNSFFLPSGNSGTLKKPKN